MIKKVLASIVVLTLVMCTLASCATSPSASGTTSTASTAEKDILDKLHQIKPNWTSQQVYDLLGTPDRLGERDVVAEVFYTVSPTKEAAIAFWSEGIKITVINSETGEKTTILG